MRQEKELNEAEKDELIALRLGFHDQCSFKECHAPATHAVIESPAFPDGGVLSCPAHLREFVTHDANQWVELEKLSFKTDISGCARCGNNHLQLEFKRFVQTTLVHTHYAACPQTGEPILMRIVETPDPE